MDSNLFSYVLLPLLIFVARIGDVSIGTLRIIFVARGNRLIAPILGFFEVLIWVIAIGEIMQNLDNWVAFIAYAGGFAAGNYIGLLIEQKLAIGENLIRIITQKDASKLISILNSSGFGTTTIEAEGSQENVHVIYSIVKRQNLKKVIALIHEFNPKAFYTIEDVRFVSQGIFPEKMPLSPKRKLPFKRWRKGK